MSQHPPSPRCLKVGEEIKRALATYFQRGHFHTPALEGYSIIISEVRMSPDLQLASVYFLPLGGSHMTEALTLLKEEKGALRKFLGHAVRLKQVPQLIFKKDESFGEADKIEKLLHTPSVVRDLTDHEDT